MALLVAAAAFSACELVPSNPDAVFVLYLNRMKSDKIAQARELLSPETRKLIDRLTAQYKPGQPPESLALLNVLDPVTPPAVARLEDTSAILQVRTLKGGTRLVHLVRADPRSPWSIDLTEELLGLQTFLGARSALDEMREQAGEYAASWKAFSDQLGKMRVKEPDVDKTAPAAVDGENDMKKPPDTRGRRQIQRKGEPARKQVR
ncbi:MAG: hypothetical protein FJY85_22815 [Deltaproteobacteria bacterium]|nr:hypothetical protein [Deltaproteobacteria bacterium]